MAEEAKEGGGGVDLNLTREREREERLGVDKDAVSPARFDEFKNRYL